MQALGRSVIARQRMARLWGLGDRSEPSSFTPGLVLMDGDDASVSIAPFITSKDGGIPAIIKLEARAAFAPWEGSDFSPMLSASIGHVLPPSLDEADAGESADKGLLLPVSWQAMCHDQELAETEIQPHVLVLTDALQLAGRPGRLVEAIDVIKRRFPGALLWCPGIGGPDNCAVYAWFGVDLFDTTRSRQAEALGAVLTGEGPRMNEPTVEDDVDHWSLAIAEVRRAIRDGNLRELAMRKSLSSPRLVEHMRRHDQLMSQKDGFLNQIVSEGTTLRIHSSDAHDDPIITDWVRFMTESYSRPEGVDDVLVLLPCSARKPYSFSRSHRAFRRALGHNAAHEVMVTSPLGLVPRDLEECWPAGHYDIPVTGNWSDDELKRVRTMLDALVKNNGYRVIINHSGMEYQNDSCEIIETRQGDSATYHESLKRLGEAVLSHVRIKRRRGEEVNIANFRSVARFHNLNDAWLEGVKIGGRFPRWKINLNGEQIAMWAPDRGGFSLAKASIPLLDKHDSLPRVHLKKDIKWKGDLNLSILESWPDTIRCGQDLLVMQDGAVVGIGRATAPAWEWPATPGRLGKMHQRL